MLLVQMDVLHQILEICVTVISSVSPVPVSHQLIAQ